MGCGATGSALASLLARAGVGYLRIIDRDYVEPSNLQRQVLFDEADAAESLPKAIAAARKIKGFNSEITVEPHAADLTPANVEELLSDVEIVLDGTDNFETRYLINDFAVSRELAVDLCRRRRQLCGHHDDPSRRDRLPGLYLSRFAARHGGNLRHFGHSELGGEFRGIDRRDRGDEASSRRARQDPPHPAVV